ncbi:insulin receptor substrate 1-B-like isoform X1 [Sinocyclocheilus anshuiensis]|uniref:insulin receptor substrate 1-B-like isoform X1 n=1 Tax=Sinocyclocheilus anshuiensis TaxID=1608454 RepID=UPI0007B7A21F|nr:PREDICTED: insulin receptor substrate 1-B-like isoform X1 [Sinocyclocheilus anshuiensis]
MENHTDSQSSTEDVRKSGYLRKQKSMHRRYFVLRTASERGPARLEYYESEKKFRGKAPVPKKALVLETCFNINKRADSKNKHMIVLYTRAESFVVAAENETDQEEWHQAMVELQCKSKALCDSVNGGDYGVPSPGPAFKEVWQVKVWPKGLGQAKNLVGIYRLCLTEKTVNFVKLNSDAAAVVLQLMNVRRCGHSENFFFVEVGRSAVTGPGEFWMQVEDSVVAQNMHETLLEAMKALSEEFRQRSKSQSAAAGAGGGTTASNPISVPSRRHHPNPPPSQVGFTRRPRTEPPGTTGGCNSTSPTSRHSFARTRTSSDGGKVDDGGGATTGGSASCSSPTTNGSCSNNPILRSTSVRAPTQVKAQHELMRSTSTPAPSAAPSLPSGSVHGSEFCAVGTGTSSSGVGGNGNMYSRIPLRQTSVSGSLSDYGSSDEYGSSPGEHSMLTPTMQAGSAGSSGGHSVGDEASNYILMSQRGASKPQPGQNALPQTRRVLRRSSSRECEAERKIMSKRASLPPMALERLAPHRRAGEEAVEEDDYAIMTHTTSRESFGSRQDSGASASTTGYLEVAVELKSDAGGGETGVPDVIGGANGAVDNGYMSMLPGVTAPPVSLSHSLSVTVSDPDSKSADDYMAMTPNNSISPPRQIRPPPSGTDGYMMMSPNSSCSPDQRGVPTAWVGSSSADSRTGSDYMNMSPISARSANSTPPPAEPHTPSDQHSQQPPPKMVYSYFSLPRSYKHNSSTRFEEGPGRGKHLVNGGRGLGGGRGLINSKAKHQEPPVGRHLSLSSSSYSSSSASSESLGEGEEKAVKVAGGAAASTPAKDAEQGPLQQRQGSGRVKQGHPGQRVRPLSLFVDVSKANTLPRVRETPLPPEPKSPGEYVSIEFKGERNLKAGGNGTRGFRHDASLPPSTHRNLPRPTSCVAGFLPFSHSSSSPTPPSTASEYVNMELGVSPSPSPISLTSLGFPPFPTPPVTPAAAPKAHDEHRSAVLNDDDAESEMGHRKSRQVSEPQPGDSPTACGDYTKMAFSLNSGSTLSSTSLKASLPDQPESVVPALGLGLGLDFPLAKVPNPDHGAKVIRADPQGRRRHCSETFQAPSSLLSCSATSSSAFPDHTQVARRLGFEGTLWGNSGSADISSQYINSGLPSLSVSQTSSMEQGLNYIDLDLANKESSHTATDGQAAVHTPVAHIFSSVLGGGAAGGSVGTGGSGGSASNLNMYASIDFYKSEELRTHQGSSSSKEGTALQSECDRLTHRSCCFLRTLAVCTVCNCSECQPVKGIDQQKNLDSTLMPLQISCCFLVVHKLDISGGTAALARH